MSSVKLHRPYTGLGLYSWSNGSDVLSDQYLSANVYRSSADSRYWEIRYFVGSESAYVELSIWTLRMARNILARVKASYRPQNGDSEWYRRNLVRDLSFEAWQAAADDEIDLIAAGRVDSE